MQPTPEEALQILDSYLKTISLNREQHNTINICIQIISQKITDKIKK
tara:strand:+ start:176 stop:316 length:141 start_codon:yes stop_codon:yes gene_type:complete